MEMQREKVLGYAKVWIAATALGCALPLACTATERGASEPVAAGQPAAQASPGETAFDRALRREAEPLESRSIEAPRMGVRFSAPAVLESIDSSEEGFDDLILAFGAEGSAQCQIFSEAQPPASMIGAFTEALFQNLPELQRRTLAASSVTFAGRVPVFHTDWMYTYREANGEGVTGFLKARTARVKDRSILCFHDAVGFRASFARLFSAVVESVELLEPPAAPEPFFTEIASVSIGDRIVGAIETRLVPDDAGDVELATVTSLAMPVGPSELALSDRYSLEYSTRDGQLINAYSRDMTPDALVTDLSLAPEGDGWAVTGTFQEKELSAPLGQGVALRSTLGQMLAVRQAVAAQGVGAAVEVPAWIPDADPTSVVVGQLRVTGRRDDGRFDIEQTFGPMEVRAVALADGSVVRAEVDLGSTVLVTERVHATGEF